MKKHIHSEKRNKRPVPAEKQVFEIRLSVRIDISDGHSYDIIRKNIKEFIADIATPGL